MLLRAQEEKSCQERNLKNEVKCEEDGGTEEDREKITEQVIRDKNTRATSSPRTSERISVYNTRGIHNKLYLFYLLCIRCAPSVTPTISANTLRNSHNLAMACLSID